MPEPSDYEIKKDARDEAFRNAVRVHDRLDTLFDFYNEHADRHAHAVIRILLALNGGAAVTLLAFTSGLAARANIPFDKIAAITSQLSWFVLGVLANCAAALFAYLVAYMRAGQIRSVKRLPEDHSPLKPPKQETLPSLAMSSRLSAF
jgi:hypothetical protein